MFDVVHANLQKMTPQTIVSVAGGQPSDEMQQGYDGIRLYKPCNGTRCDWKQDFNVHLQEKRWYPTVGRLSAIPMKHRP
jgi:hypothetical protein